MSILSKTDVSARVAELARKYAPEIVRIRRHLHAHPELAFEEVETAALVARTLESLGIPHRTGVARTGVIGYLQGSLPGPSVALRADMDALPIQEANQVPYASRVPGKMHACGHDAHTAMLLGVAMILSELREELAGHVRFIFQPSEEKAPGGALAMIEAGALEDDAHGPAPQAIFAQHVFPDLPTGKIGLRPGPYMAAVDEIYLSLHGQGGHGASPHRLGSDTVLAAAQTVVSLQQVISRHKPPEVPSILTVGKVEAPGATNVIPPEVRLEGTFRSLDEAWREAGRQWIERIVRHTAEAHNVRPDLEIRRGYPVLVNHPELTAYVEARGREYLGPDGVEEIPPTLGSEDFAWYLKHLPGVFIRLGIRNEARGIVHGLHSPYFDVDEEALPIGSGFMSYLVLSCGMEPWPL